MTEYKVYDLRQIERELGTHAVEVPEEEHVAWCGCGTMVTQDMEKCPGCGVAVVWRNSRVWRNKFGNPNDRIKKFLYTPEDDAGQYLMRRAGQESFWNRSELGRWKALREVLSDRELVDIVDYCARKARSRGLVKYVLNAAEKKAEKLPAAGKESSGWKPL